MCLLQGKGRTLYLHRRGHIKPEEKFNFPLLSSWDYGWRLGTMESQSAPCGVVTVKWCINFRKINLLNQKSPLGTKCTITSVVILCFNTRRSCNSDWLNYSHYLEFKYLKGYTMQAGVFFSLITVRGMCLISGMSHLSRKHHIDPIGEEKSKLEYSEQSESWGFDAGRLHVHVLNRLFETLAVINMNIHHWNSIYVWWK